MTLVWSLVLALCMSLVRSEAIIGGSGWHSSLPSQSVADPFYLGLGGSQQQQQQCPLHKVAFTQDLYFQYIQYKTRIPDLGEFTLCLWHRFSNHSNDHPIFSYAVGDEPQAILAWISNSDRSSYYQMAVGGHTFFRLNYPIRLNRWYHSCYSWNGKTGEWQLWINAERVGRGFHNRLVGYVIPGGGVAISGQEQRQVGGGFLEGPESPSGSGGYLGELTLLQLYSAALAPGKAHRDHKHHHGNRGSTPPPPPQPPATPPPPANPFFNGNQLIKMLNVQAQLAGNLRNVGAPEPQQQPLLQGLSALYDDGGFSALAPAAPHPGYELIPDDPFGGALAANSQPPHLIRTPVATVYNTLEIKGRKIYKRDLSAQTAQEERPKRQLFYLGGYEADDPVLKEDYPREPAEAEVMQVMSVCSSCDAEPFGKVQVISWRDTPKKLYSGAYYIPANPVCRRF